MPISTPARVAIIAAPVAVAVGYRYRIGCYRHVHRLLADVASALSHEGPEPDRRAIALA
jgi:hypothetical protein